MISSDHTRCNSAGRPAGRPAVVRIFQGPRAPGGAPCRGAGRLLASWRTGAASLAPSRAAAASATVSWETRIAGDAGSMSTRRRWSLKSRRAQPRPPSRPRHCNRHQWGHKKSTTRSQNLSECPPPTAVQRLGTAVESSKQRTSIGEFGRVEPYDQSARYYRVCPGVMSHRPKAKYWPLLG